MCYPYQGDASGVNQGRVGLHGPNQHLQLIDNMTDQATTVAFLETVEAEREFYARASSGAGGTLGLCESTKLRHALKSSGLTSEALYPVATLVAPLELLSAEKMMATRRRAMH